jgi:predicted dehydrogenase
VADYREILGQVDAVSLAGADAAASPHRRALLEHGIHVLVEKPIATTVAEARELIDVARANRCTLQVGISSASTRRSSRQAGRLKELRFVESHRLAPFKLRGNDVSVVLDLMIHDIDLIQELVGAPIESIDAVGASVFSNEIDIVERAHSLPRRLRRQHDCEPHQHETGAQAAHLPGRRYHVARPAAESPDRDSQEGCGAGRVAGAGLDRGRFVRPGRCAAAEIEAFLRSVREGSPPVVSGEDGLRALETAMQITRLVQQVGEKGGPEIG